MLIFTEPALVAKSNVIMDVKPWDDETDMVEVERYVRAIEMDGLLWGAGALLCYFLTYINVIPSENIVLRYSIQPLTALTSTCMITDSEFNNNVVFQIYTQVNFV